MIYCVNQYIYVRSAPFLGVKGNTGENPERSGRCNRGAEGQKFVGFPRLSDICHCESEKAHDSLTRKPENLLFIYDEVSSAERGPSGYRAVIPAISGARSYVERAFLLPITRDAMSESAIRRDL